MSARLSISGSIAGINFRGSWESDGENVAGSQISLGTAKTGTLTTRTDDDTGTLTMTSGHGITTGAIIDLYWDTGGGVYAYRHGVVVGTVSTNSVPIDLGAGTNLPIATTAIIAMVQEVIPCEIPTASTAANDVLLVVQLDQPGLVRFRTAEDESGTETVFAIEADKPFVLYADVMTQSPLGVALGAVESITVTHRNSSETATAKFGVAYAA